VIGGEFSKRGGAWVMSKQTRSWLYPFGRVGYASWPFARLRVNPDRIMISLPFRRTFLATRANLVSISTRSEFTASGLRVEVADNKPEVAVFWTSSSGLARIVLELALRDWNVQE
jgi:hypothetical protein